MIIKKSGLKRFVGKEYRVSAEFYDALSKDVEKKIEEAKKRAESNGRKTLKPYDI